MNKYSILITSLIISLIACSKSDTLVPALPISKNALSDITELPAILKESSGIELASNDTYWSHNDAGNKASIYNFDKQGQLLNTLKIKDTDNKDWEDLTKDQAGNLYIGDFGNNDNERKNLAIIKLSEQDLSQNNNTITGSRISFNLEDQTAFPPAKTDRNFDIEAMFSKDESLYLFTKDRTKPFKGSTKLYKLPNIEGNHTAALLAEFKTNTKEEFGRITAADISPDGATVVLLANEVVWVFTQFSGEQFFGGTVQRIDLPVNVQMEGIVFQDNCTLYLTNEKQSKQSARLFELKICEG